MNTESGTPTPRTDAYERHYIETGNVSKLINLARDLERELAEVNEKLRQHASMLKSSDAHNNDMFCKLEKERELHSETKSELAEVTKQRDTLAEALRNYMSHHRRHGFVTFNEALDAERALKATKGGSYDS
jgi:septal ring factor EnvC (AmiA/AmiB activator)